MNFNWIRSLFLALALCASGVAAPSFAASWVSFTASSSVHDIIVDNGLSLQQMIEAGHYDRVDSFLTPDRFPLDVSVAGKQKLVVELVHFDRKILTGYVLGELKLKDLRPATIAELLAFGVAFPEEQRKHPIVALGSVYEFDTWSHYVAYLSGDGASRILDTDTLGNIWWGVDYHFLAVRNK